MPISILEYCIKKSNNDKLNYIQLYLFYLYCANIKSYPEKLGKEILFFMARSKSKRLLYHKSSISSSKSYYRWPLKKWTYILGY
jgi:hypothetical protein